MPPDSIVRINLSKLKFAFLFSACIFGLLASVLLAVAAWQDQFPANELLLYIITGSLLVIPMFIVIIAISGWLWKHNRQRRFLTTLLSTHLLPLGFRQEMYNRRSKWQFADQVYVLSVNGWDVYCSQSREKPSFLAFNFLRIDESVLPNEKMLQLKRSELLRMTPEGLKLLLVNNAR